MILKIADWEFDIDMARTMEYSAAEAADHCDCAYCRNFYATVDTECPQLRPFLAQFGVNVEAPEEMDYFDVQSLVYLGSYVVFGRIRKFSKQCFTLGKVQVEPTIDPELDFDEPYFLLSFQNMQTQWVLGEPFEEVISPANEPSFLKKMWDRLLGKLMPDGPAS